MIVTVCKVCDCVFDHVTTLCGLLWKLKNDLDVVKHNVHRACLNYLIMD